MEWVELYKKIYSIKTNNWYYLSVTDFGQLDLHNNKCEKWSMNVSVWKYWMSQIVKKLY